MKSKFPRDNIHMNWRTIDGFNKPINIFISPREPGKTDTTWWEKIFSAWCEDGKPWGYLVRQVVEITEAMIQDIEDTINKWSVEPVEFKYTKGAIKDGIVDIRVKDKLFFRIISLSLPLRRIKLAKIQNIGGIFMDEYIINARSGEKYGKDEYFKIKELYTTYRREYQGKGALKMYFAGNPYSLYCPLFVGLGVDTSKLRKDTYIPKSDEEIEYSMPDGITFKDKEYKLKHNIYVSEGYAIEWGVLHPILKRWLLEKNPFYRFDEDYNNYALEGSSVNDDNIKLSELPMNYSLRFVFRVEGKYLGVYFNQAWDGSGDKFWCGFVDTLGKDRNVYCFDFNELIEGCALLSSEDKNKFSYFKRAVQKRQVTFSKIECYYLIEEIYNFL